MQRKLILSMVAIVTVSLICNTGYSDGKTKTNRTGKQNINGASSRKHPRWNIQNVPPQGYHPGGISYWNAAYFADGKAVMPSWSDKKTGKSIPADSDQLSITGYPRYLKKGQILKTMGHTMAETYHKVMATWPDRDKFFEGQVVLTWKGDADIRIVNSNQARFIPEKSTSRTGVERNGRRVYLMAPDSAPYMEIHALGKMPLTDVKCYLPDPADPQHKSLEGQLFHPLFLARIKDRNWGWIRFMDWIVTNGSPQQDWKDRRPAGHAFQCGKLNRRSPAEGVVLWTDRKGKAHYARGDRETGCAFEYLVALCNETGKNLWLNVPHLATDEFTTKLAQLIQYGSDGIEPYTSKQKNPVWKPLNPDLVVYLEYSNEIWSRGSSFPQGNWAQSKAKAMGLTRAQFVARRFSHVWQKFEDVMGRNRIVRVAAIWSGVKRYSTRLIDELYNNKELLKPDVMAIATYFGSGIQNWAYDNIKLPASKTTWESPYWTSKQIEIDLQKMFTKWKQYMLSGYSYGGRTGFDTVDQPGGFPPYVHELSKKYNSPMVAYEGGPSLYTNHYDDGRPETCGITLLMIEANRHKSFKELYTIHINQTFEKGLHAGVGFVDISKWGKWGQWGHLEYLGQPIKDAVKYQVLLETFDDFKDIRHIDNPKGARPKFDTPAKLPRALVGVPYKQKIKVSGGDGALQTKLIGSVLPKGISFDQKSLTIAGCPEEAGTAFIYLRVLDADKDPAWRTFSFNVVKPSSDPAVVIDFEQLKIPADEKTPLRPVPLPVGDYIFTCPRHPGNLKLYHPKSKWTSGFKDKALGNCHGGETICVQRADKKPFDLYSVDVFSLTGASYRIRATQIGGGVSEVVFNMGGKVPNKLQRKEIVLDFMSVKRVEFICYTKQGAIEGSQQGGAIVDNLKINMKK